MSTKGSGDQSARLDSWTATAADLARALRHPYVGIFALSLCLRLALFYAGSLQVQSLNDFATITSDGRLYMESARAIATHFNWNTQGVQVFGPGYPALLFVTGLVTSYHPAWLLLCQIVVGALGSVLLARFTFRLTGDRAVALAAGVINATSLSSISLSNALLSDCVFFVIVVTGILQLQSAAQQNRPLRGVAAGLLLGAAVLVRSAGFAVLLLLPFLVLHHEAARRRPWYGALLQSWRVLAVTAVLTLAVPGIWALRNAAVCGVAYVSKSAAVAQVRMAAAFQHEIDGSDPEAALNAIGDSVVSQAQASANADRTYLELASDHFWKRVKARPDAALRSYWHTINLATHTDWGILTAQLPKWYAPINDATHWSENYPLRYRTALLSAVGLVFLFMAGRYRLGLTLAVVYVLFALLAGLTLWQGNRIFYPGQIAWAPLVAVAVVTPIRWLRGVRPPL